MTTNRITDYEAGWLSMLVERGLASEADARAAQHRVAVAAIEEMQRRKAAAKKRKKRRRGQ